MTIQVLILVLLVAQIERSSGHADNFNDDFIVDGPTEGEVLATLEAASTLRNNICRTLASILHNPRVSLKAIQRTALKDLYDGFKSKAIETLDVVMEIQSHLKSSNRDQFLAIMNRLQSTVTPRYRCAVDIVQTAVELGDLDFNAIVPDNNAFFKNVPRFQQQWVSSRWFSRISDHAGQQYPCYRQDTFYGLILRAIRENKLILNSKVFTYILRILHFHHMPPDIDRLYTHVGDNLLAIQPDISYIFKNIGFNKYNNSLHSFIKDMLFWIGNDDNSDLYTHLSISKLIPYISLKGPELTGKPLLVIKQNSPDLNVIFSTCLNPKFPHDVISACKGLQEAIRTNRIPLPSQNILRVILEETDRDKAFMILLEELSLTMPYSDPLRLRVISLIQFLKWNNNGLVYKPKSKGQVMELIDAFSTLQLPRVVLRTIETVKAILLRLEIDWRVVLEQFPFHLYKNPRILFINIIKWLLMYSTSSFTNEDICYLNKFIDHFRIEGDELVLKGNSKRSRSSGSEDGICTLKCSAGSRKGLYEKPSQPKLLNEEDSQPLELSFTDKCVKEVYKVDPDVLLSPLRRDTPKEHREFLNNLFSNKRVWRVLEKFDYGAYSKRGDLLKGVLTYFKQSEVFGREMAADFDAVLKDIDIKGLGQKEFKIQSMYIDDEGKETHRNITDIFKTIIEENLTHREKAILENLLKHFRDSSIKSKKNIAPKKKNPNRFISNSQPSLNSNNEHSASETEQDDPGLRTIGHLIKYTPPERQTRKPKTPKPKPKPPAPKPKPPAPKPKPPTTQPKPATPKPQAIYPQVPQPTCPCHDEDKDKGTIPEYPKPVMTRPPIPVTSRRAPVTRPLPITRPPAATMPTRRITPAPVRVSTIMAALTRAPPETTREKQTFPPFVRPVPTQKPPTHIDTSNPDECVEYTEIIWQISGVDIDILSLLEAIPRQSLPLNLQSNLDTLIKLFVSESPMLMKHLGYLNIKNYATKGDLFIAICNQLASNSQLDGRYREVIRSLISYIINKSGIGAEPLHTGDHEVVEIWTTKQERPIIIVNLQEVPLGNRSRVPSATEPRDTTFAELFQYFDNGPLQIVEEKVTVMEYLAKNTDILFKVIDGFEVEQYDSKAFALIQLLTRINNLEVPESIKNACMDLMVYIENIEEGTIVS